MLCACHAALSSQQDFLQMMPATVSKKLTNEFESSSHAEGVAVGKSGAS